MTLIGLLGRRGIDNSMTFGAGPERQTFGPRWAAWGSVFSCRGTVHTSWFGRQRYVLAHVYSLGAGGRMENGIIGLRETI